MQTIFRFIGLCVFTLAVSIWFAACASGGGSRGARGLAVETDITVFPQLGHSDAVNSVAYSPDGKTVASGSNDNTVKLWDALTGREIKSLSSHFPYVTSLVFSPDGKTIAAGYHDSMVKLWDVVTGMEIMTFSCYSPVYSIAYSQDGKTIASGAYDKTVKLWDASTGREIGSFIGHSHDVTSVVFSFDGKTIASGSSDGTVKLWNVANGKLIITCTGHSAGVRFVTYSPNGKIIASGSSDGTTRLWDISTGKELAAFVSFSGSDTNLAAATRGLTVETQTAATSNEGEWLSITPDGYYQASSRGDRYLNVRVNNTVSGIDAYRSVFYNPDVVQARLRGLPDPASKGSVTIQQAAAFTPPTVTIQSPANFTTTNTAIANLSVAVTDQSQPIKNIRVFVNGRSVGRNELPLQAIKKP